MKANNRATWTVMYNRIGYPGRTLRVEVQAVDYEDALELWGERVPHGAHTPRAYRGRV